MANDFLMEQRKEFLVYPTGGDSRDSLHTAHFLKPFVSSIDGAVAAPSFDSLSFSADAGDLPLTANLVGYRAPPKNWKEWVDKMKSTHRSAWEKAGILDAIIGSTITIHRHGDLMLGFLEKWCPATNSFVFPWGEATVTLEDIAVLGGYSVLGDCVLSTRQDEETQEILKKLIRARSKFFATKARKACQGAWMTKFMGSQSEIEHQAFIVYWLSRFVFPSKFDTVEKNLLPIAARLAAGAKIALAPAVLATIYKNLSLWKAAEIAARKPGAKEGSGNDSLKEFTVSGLLRLVQVWIWERFPSLRPNPKSIQLNEPRLARWDKLRTLGIDNLSMVISSAREEFLWRPYASQAGNVFPAKLYQDHGYWAIVDSDLDENLQGFIRCLRASELVGMEADCIEQYLPHRVGMQFGLDQDIPGHVSRVHANAEIAWNDYTRPISDAEVYVPPRHYKPQCTTRYLNWWKKLSLGWRETLEPRCPGKSSSAFVCPKVEGTNLASIKLEADLPPPPGFSPKKKRIKVSGSMPLQDGMDTTTSRFTDQEVSPKQRAPTSPVAGSKKISIPKSSKRKNVSDFTPLQDGMDTSTSRFTDQEVSPKQRAPTPVAGSKKISTPKSSKRTKVSDSMPLQDGMDTSTSRFTDQEVSPMQRAPTSPVAGSKKISTAKSLKRKILDSSSCLKISDFYAPVSSPCCSSAKSSHTKGPHSRTETKLTAPQLSSTSSYQNMNKHQGEDQAKDNLSSTADNVNVEEEDVNVDEPVESKANQTEANGVTDKQDVKKLGNSSGEGERQSSIDEMPPELAQLEARISILEKWYDLLKSSREIGRRSDT